ncbi:MAG TPA: hypothetical protein VK193_12180 [Methyloceanibacter sp.]|jgi:hypothetical protein|nr:hypothetical protein [Methyloceanibacter sp.]
MSVTNSACHLLAALLVLVLPGSALAAMSLAEALKQEDAKYLDAPDVTAKDDAPKIEAGGGEEGQAPKPQEIGQGAVKAALSYTEAKGDDGQVTRVPIITIFANGKEVAKLEGEDTFYADPPVSLQIAELDPSNQTPEVVVSFYSGGAHCCSETSVVASSADGSAWKTIDVGEFDGGPLLATDLDGDGRYEFETRDNAFLYAFGCYACSTAPLEILAIETGAVKNVTSDERFKPVHAAYLKSMISDAPEEEADANGYLAGYVGEKSLLGESKGAWALMLNYYDKASDWGLETCDKPLDENGECPGQTIKLTFPDALERMLKENGYKIEK